MQESFKKINKKLTINSFSFSFLFVFLLVILLSLFLQQTPLAFATNTNAPATPTPPAAVNLESPIAAQSVPELIGTVIKTILGIVGALALLMFVYGGFTWLTSGGSPDKIKKGKDILIWATIGLAVIFASYTLVDFVIRTITGT